MRDFMAVTKALADETRVRLLLSLQKKDVCLCQLIAMVRLAPSTVSKHMAILKGARLAESRKEGRWIYYRLPGDDAPAMVQQAIQWASRSLNSDRRIVDDRTRLKEILEIDPSELCDRRTRSPAASGKGRTTKPKCGGLR